jgi:ankyrin repeat protein
MRTGLFVAFAGWGLALLVHAHDWPAVSATLSAREAQAQPTVDFARDVQPILRRHCVECHGPSQQMRGLRLDRRRDAMPNRVGANGSRIVPGNSAASPVYRRLTGEGGVARMPPQSPLSAEQIGIIKTWIDQGADWPDALSGDVVSSPPDPAVVAMMHALRDGDGQQFARRLRDAPASVNARGDAGWTPLMYAALYGDAEAVRTALAAGAAPNIVNESGATALIYALDSVEKTKVLLDAGADPNARTGEGRTALLVAAGRTGSYPIVKMLLDNGASASARLSDGRGVLPIAVFARDASLLQLLIDRGAPTSPVPLGAALYLDCSACFDVLLKLAQPQDFRGALGAAVELGDLPRIQMLLDRGAQPGPNILQSAALSKTPTPPDVVQQLIARGADVNAKTSTGPVIDFARRHGNTTLEDALRRAGAKDDGAAAPALKPMPASSARSALERALPPLQRADVAFIQKAGCVSCHNNSLTAMTIAAARPTRLRVDESVARSQLQRIAAYMDENRERALEGAGIPGGIDTVSYILMGMAAENYPSDPITDAWARYVKGNQSPDGRFQCVSSRPPLESSDFQVTAASIRSLRAYAPKSQRAEYDAAVTRAVRWLESATPATTEDRAFTVLGLIWSGGSNAAVAKAAQQLQALQRPDGGWAQTSALQSDAYATGQALVALRESRIVAISDDVYQRGIRYLLNSQLADGSWYVRTRAPAIQPYFDSDFPHGPDQFISAAATNWAAMALIGVVQ